HDVFAILVAPGTPRRPEELLAIARRAPEIRLQNEVAVRREVLVLEVESVAVGGMRPAMAAHDERVRAATLSIPVRIHQPSLDRRPVLALVLDAFGFAERHRRQERVVDVRELPLI